MPIDSLNFDQNQISHSTPIIKVGDLEGKCAYFPLTDCHNLRIFKDHNYKHSSASDEIIKSDISNRLYMSLLLFDKVILHCSDPLRSELVYDILLKNSHFIDDGSILFVFSNSINDIKRDYKNYIIGKRNEYNQNDFSDKDIKSLDQPHMTDGYYSKVITLLEKTPFILKKGKNGSDVFKTLIQNDLDENVESAIMGSSNFARSHIRLLNLTLFQLLNLKYISGTNICDVFEHSKIETFIANWISETDDGAPFSRHTIIEELRASCVSSSSGLGKTTQTKVIDVIETRLSLLYSKLNSGPHQIIEFHPALEKRSVFCWEFFKMFLNEINENIDVHLTPEIVLGVRESDDWVSFRNEFLACMAEWKAFSSTAQKKDEIERGFSDETFSKILRQHDLMRYDQIKNILRSEYNK